MREKAMKRVAILLLSVLVLALSCDHNVYIDDGMENDSGASRNIWRVGTTYFATANEAIRHMMEQNQTRDAARTGDEGRVVVLTRPVLAADSDGITGPGYGAYVEDESLRGGITVPGEFAGSLTIDFGGFRYDFADTSEAFFVVEGGDDVHICNGTTVIFNGARHEPYAVAVNSDKVTIEGHLVDDRRVGNKLLYIGESGHLGIGGVDGTLSGEVAVVTDGTKGAVLDIASDITITSIYTKYKNGDGTVEDEIDDEATISDGAKSKINIRSGEVRIGGIHKKTDYYNGETGSLFDKAVISTLGTVEDTKVASAHDICAVIEKAIEASEGKAEHLILHHMTHHPEKKATCTSTGSREYWTCDAADECVGRYYTDEDGTGYGTNLEGLTLDVDSNAHSLEHVEAKAETCTEDGNPEYWHCTLCGKYFSDKGGTEMQERDTTIPHHTVSTEWKYDLDSHWHECASDGRKVGEESHSWGEWQNRSTGSMTYKFSECGVCGGRKVDKEAEYAVYDIGIGKVEFRKLGSIPCGDFLVDGNETASGKTVEVDGPAVQVVYRPMLNSNTSYTKTYAIVVCGGTVEEMAGETDGDGWYTACLDLSGKTRCEVSVHVETEGGSLGFDCTLQRK